MVNRSRLALGACISISALAAATPAFAGEATGNFERTGKRTPVQYGVAQSICSFSGQNPERFLPETDPGYEPGRTQSWGQIPKSERDAMPSFLHPSSSCNGRTGFASGG